MFRTDDSNSFGHEKSREIEKRAPLLDDTTKRHEAEFSNDVEENGWLLHKRRVKANKEAPYSISRQRDGTQRLGLHGGEWQRAPMGERSARPDPTKPN